MNLQETNLEVDNRTGVNHEGQNANVPVQRLTASSIIGDHVENAHGDDLGKIDNLMVNLYTGQIEYAVLDFGTFLGLGGKLFAIPFSELHLDPAREIFILNKDNDYLKSIPGFDKSHWPGTNNREYFEDVNTYWGAAYQP